MGGCRCTYRNCMVKTDGKTHMFHYPVFDKIRCHQWLINAHRLEYLNLKVSQLKNRVVCQHHFKDQYFMNFKKEKLTFEAIPTEDGPFCDPSKWIDKTQEFSKLYPIVIEDIENDYFPINDKKANFSLKYIDFLTNSEVDTTYRKNDINTLSETKCDNFAQLNFVLNSNIEEKPHIIGNTIDETELGNDKLTSTKNNIKKAQPQPIFIVPRNDSKPNRVETTQKNECVEINTPPDKKIESTLKTKPKVTIISEKKITEPVSLTGNFEPISPSIILNVANLKRNNCTRKNASLDNRSLEGHINIIHEGPEPVITQKTEDSQYSSNLPPNQGLNAKVNANFNENKETKISILKNKLSPERVAAIREKRQFNMKLKDIIESYVIKVEEPEKNTSQNMEQFNPNEKEKVPSSCKDEHFKNNEIFLSNLEARMTRMENLLLSKIDQNTQRFMDLKKSIVTTPQKKRTVSTQTATSDEAYKRFLYSEISKYLGPEANNLIYQELFIDKFARNSCVQSSPQKRRRYR